MKLLADGVGARDVAELLQAALAVLRRVDPDDHVAEVAAGKGRAKEDQMEQFLAMPSQALWIRCARVRGASGLDDDVANLRNDAAAAETASRGAGSMLVGDGR